MNGQATKNGKFTKKRLTGSFAKRIFFAYLIMLIAVLAAVNSLINRYAVQFIKEKTIEYNAKMMNSLFYDLQEFDGRIKNCIDLLYLNNMFAGLTELEPPVFDYQALKRVIGFERYVKESIAVNNLEFYVNGLFIYLGNGTYYDATPMKLYTGVDVRALDWYRSLEFSPQKSLYYGPLHENYRRNIAVSGDSILYIEKITLPPSVSAGEMPVIVFSIKYADFIKYFSVLPDSGLLVRDRSGKPLYQRGITEKVLKKITASQPQSVKHAGAPSIPETFFDNDLLCTSIFLEKFGWTITATDSASVLFRDVTKLARTITLFISMAGIMAILVSLAVSARLTVPVKTLNRIMERMEESDNDDVAPIGNDEFGRIGERFNIMKQRIQQLNRDKYELKLKEREAVLLALQARINPHFLYNTLDNIYCIAQMEGIENIGILTKNLSQLMRYSIDSAVVTASLDDELLHVEHYMQIISIRFDNKIDFSIDCPERLKNRPVLKLILQPIVENAVKHGIIPQKNKRGVISLNVRETQNRLIVTISDNGTGMNQTVLSGLRAKLDGCTGTENTCFPGGGMGLTNVHERIRLYCAPDCGLYVESETGRGTCVTLTLS